MDSDYEDSDIEEGCDSDLCEGFEVCCRRGSVPSVLPFDINSLEGIILKLIDQFDFRVVLQDNKIKSAILVTSGLTLAGSLIGKHFGGKIGAAVGGAVGGICGIGLVVVSMRDIWKDIREKLGAVFDIVYDYLAGLGIDDYKMAAKFLMSNSADSSQLALVIMQVTSEILGKKVLSSLATA
ncbi:uncharacterized protein LOC121735896 [Aricia agestis]|uniref:uncharacterized protein LOC121735896 n=1 Tax=Aricia agestis TaxID=91739 RepID=UPI001C201D28|nr:uncharacterized protein LOC121735896 [Aricia agestis]